MTPEEYGQRLAAKDLEIRLLHTAIDKSNEALEAAVEMQEEHDRYKAALEKISKMGQNPIDGGIAAWEACAALGLHKTNGSSAPKEDA
jgi:hypothetical protein